MKCDFTVGQKVVCVVENWHQIVAGAFLDVKHPERNQIYQITCITLLNDSVYLYIQGFNDRYEYKGFRKLEEKKTDISLLTRFLNSPELEIVE